jgi:hypothetical protein
MSISTGSYGDGASNVGSGDAIAVQLPTDGSSKSPYYEVDSAAGTRADQQGPEQPLSVSPSGYSSSGYGSSLLKLVSVIKTAAPFALPNIAEEQRIKALDAPNSSGSEG